jgi:Ala-tRNA(Pro) deacylase
MSTQNIKKFLDQHHIKYISMMHSPAYTAQEIAESAHVSGRQLAKTVIVNIADREAMVVLPGNQQVDFKKLTQATGADKVELATEHEFKDKFLDCELGAMPPFGNLYNMPVYISSLLAKHDYILFNAGSHSELIQMSYHDFERIVKPNVISL